MPAMYVIDYLREKKPCLVVSEIADIQVSNFAKTNKYQAGNLKICFKANEIYKKTRFRVKKISLSLTK